MKRGEELILLVAAVAGVGLTAYGLFRKPSAATANSVPGGPLTAINSYDPTGGLSIFNIGGSQALGGKVASGSIGNSAIGDTPIGIDPLTGNTINTIESGWAGGDVTVDPSSWQGTTNQSGSVTYLNNELAGEGSSIGALQGVTY